MILKEDPCRKNLPETGVPFRALNCEGEWESIDLAHLTKESVSYLCSDRGLDFTKDLLGITLGHGHLTRRGAA